MSLVTSVTARPRCPGALCTFPCRPGTARGGRLEGRARGPGGSRSEVLPETAVRFWGYLVPPCPGCRAPPHRNGLIWEVPGDSQPPSTGATSARPRRPYRSAIAEAARLLRSGRTRRPQHVRLDSLRCGSRVRAPEQIRPELRRTAPTDRDARGQDPQGGPAGRSPRGANWSAASGVS
jgi:hypothetical protein